LEWLSVKAGETPALPGRNYLNIRAVRDEEIMGGDLCGQTHVLSMDYKELI